MKKILVFILLIITTISCERYKDVDFESPYGGELPYYLFEFNTILPHKLETGIMEPVFVKETPISNNSKIIYLKEDELIIDTIFCENNTCFSDVKIISTKSYSLLNENEEYISKEFMVDYPFRISSVNKNNEFSDPDIVQFSFEFENLNEELINDVDFSIIGYGETDTIEFDRRLISNRVGTSIIINFEKILIYMDEEFNIYKEPIYKYFVKFNLESNEKRKFKENTDFNLSTVTPYKDPDYSNIIQGLGWVGITVSDTVSVYID